MRRLMVFPVALTLRKISRFERYVSTGLVALLVLILVSKYTTPVSAAQTTPPPYAHGWYINNPDTSTNGAMYTLGQSDGSRDNATCTNSAVFLDFGQVYYQNGVYGVSDFNNAAFVSDTTVQQAAERYAAGWYANTGTCPRLHLIIGVNNYDQCRSGGSCTPYAAGQQWGNVVNNVQTWLNNSGYSWQITAWGGDDMEQPYNDPTGKWWDCPTKTRNFVDGFNSNNPSSALFIDYGTAWVPATCIAYNDRGWTASDVYYVAYGAGAPEYPQPEIYRQSALDSWMNLGYYMFYKGVLTDCNQSDPITGTYCAGSSTAWTPTYAWQQLWNKVSSQGTLDYATNIKYQGQ